MREKRAILVGRGFSHDIRLAASSRLQPLKFLSRRSRVHFGLAGLK